ncbi:glycoside hydrolase family 38 N-terminal domain-containing protein [Portibacter lacus]|uniref:Glycosyl hydrolase family 38 n=1 Tax=Portibacter lacus TaxID=1099794 RepID=A0AA37WHF5_9BACT|nr:glycoside hydrolase family 38 C-terminal domain-containing protein [Portibacter lacus]GLR18735.1 hypothetical protein GCM10007940_33510 [Portibacter lacus]
MYKTKIYTASAVLLFLLLSLPVSSQQTIEIENEWPVRSETYYQGFLTPNEGERLDFLQNLQDESVALLVRANDGKKYLSFSGEPVVETEEEYLTFVWEMALAARSGDAKKTPFFDLYVNSEKKYSFPVFTDPEPSDWIIKLDDGSELAFVRSFKDDKKGDLFGFMFLTIKSGDYPVGERLSIKIQGSKSASQDWYMAFQNVVKKELTAEILPAIKNTKNGLKQPLEIKYNHLGKKTNCLISIDGKDEKSYPIKAGGNEFTLELEPVEEARNIKLSFAVDGETSDFHLRQKPVRNFEVYFLPHSHIDIGFTHLQHEVEEMQWRNFEEGIALAEKTKDYPEASRYKWNSEIMWAVDSYLKTATPEKKEKFIEAVKKGWIGLDALYGSELTGLQRDEELLHIADAANSLESNYGIKLTSGMITDVPGYSWGIHTALFENDIKYFSIGPNHMPHLANGGYQVGNTINEWGDIPFYWVSPSGEDKILFWMSTHGYSWFHDWLLGTLDKSGGTPILKFLNELEDEGYPYDIVQLRYTMGDNAGPDQGMPDFIKNWNETYAYPKFRIATTSEMFKDFEAKYGDKLPTYSGDLTPYWEDGAASSATETGLNRNTADKLIQAEALWAMSEEASEFPVEVSDEAWRNVLLFSEHTWGAISSKSDPDSDFTKDQWKVKQSFALTADSLAVQLLTSQVEEGNISDFYVTNTSSWKRSGLITLPNWDENYVLTHNGIRVMSQFLTDGSLVFIARGVPAYETRLYEVSYSPPSNERMTKYFVRKDIDIKFDKNGNLSTLRLRNRNHNFIDSTSQFGFNEYWYTGLNAENPQRSSNVTIDTLHKGPIFDEYMITSTAPGAESLSRRIRVVHMLGQIDIENTVDKKKIVENENVRYAFPFSVPNAKTKIDQAFFILEPDENQLAGANKNFYCPQRFVDFSNDEYGVILANLDVPLVEFGGMIGQEWMQDMNKRKWRTEHEMSTLLFSWVMNNTWFVNYKGHQEGPITSRYSIKPYQKWSDADRKKFGMEQSQPLIVSYADLGQFSNKPLVNISGSNDVIVTSFKPSRDQKGWVIKLLNATDKKSIINLGIDEKYAVYKSNNKEANGEKVSGDLSLKPWEFLIIKVQN